MSKGLVAIVGFGKTGRALLDFLLGKNIFERIILFDDNPIDDSIKQANYEKKGVEFIIGGDNFSKLEDAEIVLLSPGVNGKTNRFNELRVSGVKVVSEIEFSSRFIQSKIIAVTGTNGKSTTVSLIHHILSKSGIKSILAGNIGRPLISEVNNIQNDSAVVLEVSSFQLEEIEGFRPYIAVLLNITPDHLNRYSSMNDYITAKSNILKNQKSCDYMVLNYDDKLLREKMNRIGEAKKIWFSLNTDLENSVFVKEDYIHLNLNKVKKRISLKRNPLLGVHNLENLVASVAVSSLMGVHESIIEDSFKDFKGLSHRMEYLGKIGNVEFINDSKATNVDATLKSINSIDKDMVLILGGKDKGSNFTVLESPIKEKVKKVLLIGKASNLIYKQLKNIREKFDFVEDFSDAIEKGYRTLNCYGGVVLLAPGCSSFDMFNNFEHRGDVFKREFLELKDREKKNNG